MAAPAQMIATAITGLAVFNGFESAFFPALNNYVYIQTFVSGALIYGPLALPFVVDPQTIYPVLLKFGMLLALADIVSNIIEKKAAAGSKLKSFFAAAKFREYAGTMLAAAFIAYLKSMAQ